MLSTTLHQWLNGVQKSALMLQKLGVEEGHSREWPDEIVMSDDIKKSSR